MAKSTPFDGIKTTARPHEVVVVAFDGMIPFDLATPLEVFERVRSQGGHSPYRVRVCGVGRTIVTPQFDLRLRHGLGAMARADSIFVPGMNDIDAPVSEALRRALRRAAGRGARIASICTGAFVLAASGVLRGKSATTHWLAAQELRRRYPDIAVNENALFTDDGNVLTSAGAAAGIDLCLHIVAKDHGAAVAAAAAKASVVPLQRAGGQAQFIEHKTSLPSPPPLAELLSWIEDNLQGDLSLAKLARRAGTSSRTLSRRFAAQLGVTPLSWVTSARVRRAKELLETTELSVEQVATEVGFHSASSFRERFVSVVRIRPSAYRGAFSRSSKQ